MDAHGPPRRPHVMASVCSHVPMDATTEQVCAQQWWAVHTCVRTRLCVRVYTGSFCLHPPIDDFLAVSFQGPQLTTDRPSTHPPALPCPPHSRWQVGDTEAQNEGRTGDSARQGASVSSPVSEMHGLGSHPGSASHQPRALRQSLPLSGLRFLTYKLWVNVSPNLMLLRG